MSRIQTVVIILAFLMPNLLAQYSAAEEVSRTPVPVTAISSSITSNDDAAFGTDQDSEEEIRRLFVQYKDALSTQMFAEADTLAKQMVDLSIKKNGHDSKTTSVALTNLAILQASNEDPVSAINNFVAAIDILERLDNRLSKDLIVPLKQLGTAQLRAGHPDRARAAWYRSVHISHVNFGPHNMQQVESLYEIAHMYSRAGMSKEASKVRRRIYYLKSRETENPGAGHRLN